MPKKIYDRIVRWCFAVIVGSVLLADRFGEWQVISLVVALCAGLVAGGVYFYDQSRRHYQKKSSSVEKSHTPHTSVHLHLDLAGVGAMGSVEDSLEALEYLRIIRESRLGERWKGSRDPEQWPLVISEGLEIAAPRHTSWIEFDLKRKTPREAFVGKFAKQRWDEEPVLAWSAHDVVRPH